MATKNLENQGSKHTHRQVHSTDIVKLILEDHKALKRLIVTLKDTDLDFEQRKIAFDEFAPLLVSHAKPEEQTLYNFMKANDELREDGYEGDVEHTIADQLLEEIKRTQDSEMWSARVKVLAELLEHHISEEEDEMLPEIEAFSPPIERAELGELYLQLRTALLQNGGEDSPKESEENPLTSPMH